MRERFARPRPNQGRQKIQTAAHEKVLLHWREFLPHLPSEESILYLPGWPMDARVKSVEDLPQSLAEHAQVKAIAVDTTPKRFSQNYQSETTALLMFLQQRNIKKLTIVAHSHGAEKAVSLAVSLKKLRGTDQEITLDGLIFLDATGMYEQRGISKKFLLDNFLIMREEKDFANDASRAAFPGVIGSVVKKLAFAHVHYPRIFHHEIAAMSHKNPLLSEIDVPVIFIQPEKDLVSRYNLVAPLEETLDTTSYPKTTQQQREAMREEELQQRERRIIESRRNRATNTRRRGEILQEKMLQKSPDVTVLVPSKHARHTGMTLYRYKQVARVSLDYLKRRRKLMHTS